MPNFWLKRVVKKKPLRQQRLLATQLKWRTPQVKFKKLLKTPLENKKANSREKRPDFILNE